MTHFRGVLVPLRPGIEASDLVTSAVFADSIGIPRPRVRKWLERAEGIIGRKVEPVGMLGPYPVYDWRDLADLEREMYQRRQQRETAQAA